MQIGDLVVDKEFPEETGLLLKIKDDTCKTPYGILCPNGKVGWFTQTYVDEKCEVISESR